MSENKPINEGYQPGKGNFGYQPNKIEKGYQPSTIPSNTIGRPPKGGSSITPPKKN